MADAMGERVAPACPQRAHSDRDRSGVGRNRWQMRLAGHAAAKLYGLVQPPDFDSAGQGGLPSRRALARGLYTPRCERRSADGINPPAPMRAPWPKSVGASLWAQV